MKNLKESSNLLKLLDNAKTLLEKENKETQMAKYLYFDLFNKNEDNIKNDVYISSFNKAKYLKSLSKIIKKNMPLQYVTKKAYFYKRKFYVNKNVLIPRFDSEVMIETILKNHNKGNLLEIGTGSGCLVVSLKKECENYNAFACDISNKALKIARKNARKNDANITFFRSDLFKKVHGKFDIIIANLPYLRKDEITPNIEKEPKLALISPGKDGLFIIKRFLDNLSQYLKDDGKCYIEHNPNQTKLIKDYIDCNLSFDIKTCKDYNNLDRFSILWRK